MLSLPDILEDILIVDIILEFIFRLPVTMLYPLTVLYSLMFVAGVAGNLMVCTVVVRYQQF